MNFPSILATPRSGSTDTDVTLPCERPVIDERPHVLLTNDDGIDSLGLEARYERLADRVAVTVVAPAEDPFDVTVSEDGDTVRFEDRSYDPLREDVTVGFPPDEGETDRRALADGDVSVSSLGVRDRVVESNTLTDALSGISLA